MHHIFSAVRYNPDVTMVF